MRPDVEQSHLARWWSGLPAELAYVLFFAMGPALTISAEAAAYPLLWALVLVLVHQLRSLSVNGVNLIAKPIGAVARLVGAIAVWLWFTDASDGTAARFFWALHGGWIAGIVADACDAVIRDWREKRRTAGRASE